MTSYLKYFDHLVDDGNFPNVEPVILDRLRIQGVPVDETPCIDIYDGESDMIYTSVDVNNEEEQIQWQDENGEFKVNVPLCGDFVIICRFGGKHKNNDDHLVTTLFRYVGSTGFIVEGPMIMKKSKVDIMKRYETH